MKNFKRIILDLDGPLLNGKERHYKCYADILLENGFHPINKDQYWKMKRERMGSQAILEKSSAIDIKSIFQDEWSKRIELPHYLLLDQLQPQVLDILTKWKSAYIELYLITMRLHLPNLHWQLKQFGILHFFEKVIAPKNMEIPVQKANLLMSYLKGWHLDKCLWIGDTEVDIQAAKQLGICVAALHDGLRTESYLKSFNPNYLYLNLRDLVLGL